MAITQVRGNTQIKPLTITNDEIDASADIETSKLADGAEFLWRDGSVPLTGDLDADGNKVTGLADGSNPTDAVTYGQVSGALFDEKVKVSSDDTTADYLEEKISGALGKISLTTTSPAGDESLQIDIGADVFDKTVDNDSDITVNLLGSPTYTNLREVRDVTQSSGYVSGGTITDAGGGAVDVAAGAGFIRATSTVLSPILNFDFSGALSVALTDKVINYIYVRYNAGLPDIQVTTDPATIDRLTEISLGRVYRHGTTVNILQAGQLLVDFPRRVAEESFEVFGLQRTTGMITSETGTRNLGVTAGEAWAAMLKYITTAKDTSVADTFDYWYRDGIGGWTRVTGQAQINNTQYDDGDGTLGTLTDNYYGVHWVCLDMDDQLHVVYGQSDYSTLSAAQTVQPPTLPPLISGFGLLIAKIIILKGRSSFNEIQVSKVEFTPSSPTNHNELALLQGGTAGQYYHLTSAEYAGRAFGQNFSYVQTAATVTNNTATYATGQTLTTGTLPAGVYRIECSYEWNQSENNNDWIESRVNIDASLQVMYHYERAATVVGWRTWTSPLYWPIITPAAITITLQFREPSAGGATISLRNRKIAIWRVS